MIVKIGAGHSPPKSRTETVKNIGLFRVGGRYPIRLGQRWPASLANMPMTDHPALDPVSRWPASETKACSGSGSPRPPLPLLLQGIVARALIVKALTAWHLPRVLPRLRQCQPGNFATGPFDRADRLANGGLLSGSTGRFSLGCIPSCARAMAMAGVGCRINRNSAPCFAALLNRRGLPPDCESLGRTSLAGR